MPRQFRIPVLGRALQPVGSEFVTVEALGGTVLLAATVAALIWANTAGASYDHLWARHLTIGSGDLSISEDLRHWVNDGLMTVFFFVVGLEIKRELVRGELRDRRTASLPVLAAVGGMIVPGAALRLGERRWCRAARLGDPDGDRHRVRGRGARRARLPGAEPPQALPAHSRDRRRHRRDPRDRALLLQGHRGRRGSSPWVA